MIEAMNRNKKIEFVLGTRYGEGVSIDENWPIDRKIISNIARWMSKPLTPLSDPMSGFFAIRKEVVSLFFKFPRIIFKFERGKDINPIGFKIALELYIKCSCSRFAEVPFSFGVRTYGESKLTGAVILRYLEQLCELYHYQFANFEMILLGVALLMVLFLVCK